VSFVERSVIICPYLGGSTVRGSTIFSPAADFWQYTSSYREQPSVHFLRELIVQVGEGGAGGGGSRVWSSFPNLNLLLQPEELATPIVRVMMWRWKLKTVGKKNGKEALNRGVSKGLTTVFAEITAVLLLETTSK